VLRSYLMNVFGKVECFLEERECVWKGTALEPCRKTDLGNRS
jgi:hypothetical protein